MNQFEFLKEVKKEIEGGWTKGYLKIPTTKNKRGYSVCMVGAIFEIQNNNRGQENLYPVSKRAEILLNKCIVRKVGWNRSITSFNDSTNTKKKDVLEVVDCAISEAALEVKNG